MILEINNTVAWDDATKKYIVLPRGYAGQDWEDENPPDTPIQEWACEGDRVMVSLTFTWTSGEIKTEVHPAIVIDGDIYIRRYFRPEKFYDDGFQVKIL
jgi:hypothetical protein